ncbi:carboxyl-terminal processing protease [Melghiribacillus thermohalophilus]|uniref:C-terminal processing peptidase n=2 Tax=Melghiribacillus thermohalophilus TaxID=1324956 RepID=A0A4R3MSQ3_9BACI|nr:carboxyl-terminal processing protease [Melghiribacillus thermohalophilus]
MYMKGRNVAILFFVAMLFGAGMAYAGTQIVEKADSADQETEENDQIDEDGDNRSQDNSQPSEEEKLELIEDYRQMGAFSKVLQAYSIIQNNYVEDVKEEELIEGAIQGMLDTLDDPYSVYMDKETVEQFNDAIESSFEGIGAEVSIVDGRVTIVAPIKDSPAEKAGLKPNDQIIEVDGENIEGMDLYDAVLKIRGEKGTPVTLTIKRPGTEELLEVEVIRDTIPIETVYTSIKEVNGQTAGIIEITSFSENTAADFSSALKKLEEEEQIDGLVIDVRGNPGGLFTSVENILGHFITKDDPYVQIEKRDGEKVPYYSDLNEGKDYPIAVLIDEGSASASEILAAAMNEAGDYPLVGTKTFGKGTVQQAIPMGDGSDIKLTIYKWLTPEGNWIHEKGIEPTVPVEQPEFFYANPIQVEESLSSDMTGDQIASAQLMLKGIGYDPGRTDGYFDDKTEQAVKAFQQDQGLQVTGQIDNRTASVLEQQIVEAVRSEENDRQLKKALEVLFQ